jgi:hypothetical protein
MRSVASSRMARSASWCFLSVSESRFRLARGGGAAATLQQTSGNVESSVLGADWGSKSSANKGARSSRDCFDFASGYSHSAGQDARTTWVCCQSSRSNRAATFAGSNQPSEIRNMAIAGTSTMQPLYELSSQYKSACPVPSLLRVNAAQTLAILQGLPAQAPRGIEPERRPAR